MMFLCLFCLLGRRREKCPHYSTQLQSGAYRVVKLHVSWFLGQGIIIGRAICWGQGKYFPCIVGRPSLVRDCWLPIGALLLGRSNYDGIFFDAFPLRIARYYLGN